MHILLVFVIPLILIVVIWRCFSVNPKKQNDGPLKNPSGLYKRIAKMYDDSCYLWEQTWGEHLHHGFYGFDGKLKTDHKQAQVDLIEEVLKWAGITKATRILDSGCGVGGSSRYLARKFNAKVTGITLSPVQAQRGNELAKEQHLETQCDFRVADALNTPFEENTFDVVWALESGEHMPDKEQFVKECTRVLKPGGVVVMVVWCHRNEPPPLTESEISHLKRIYKVYELPYMCSLESFVKYAKESGLKDIKSSDWSQAVAPFWIAVIKSAFSFKTLVMLIASGWKIIRAAFGMVLMITGFRRKLIVFGLVRGTK